MGVSISDCVKTVIIKGTLDDNGGLIAIKGGSVINENAHITTDGGTVVIGEDCKIRPHTYVNAEKGRIEIDDNITINPFTYLGAGRGRIIIGDKCALGSGLKISCVNHNFENTKRDIKDQLCSSSDVIIGKNCFFGMNVTVLPGVTIGSGVVVGAGSVVTHDIEDNAVVVGNPARIIRHRGDGNGSKRCKHK